MTSTGTRAPRPDGSLRLAPRRALAVFAAVNAVSAWGGAVALIAGWIDFGDRLNQRLPFGSLMLAGAALAAVVAIPLSVVATLAWTGDLRAGRAAVLTGLMLVGWIALQLAFLREFSAFQPAYVAVGVVLVAAGRRVRPLNARVV